MVDWDLISRAVADSVLMLAGGSFAAAYFNFSMEAEGNLAPVIFAFIIGLVLIGIAIVMRSISPPEVVRLSPEEWDQLRELIEECDE